MIWVGSGERREQAAGFGETEAHHSHTGKVRAIPQCTSLLSSRQQWEGAWMCMVFLPLGLEGATPADGTQLVPQRGTSLASQVIEPFSCPKTVS